MPTPFGVNPAFNGKITVEIYCGRNGYIISDAFGCQAVIEPREGGNNGPIYIDGGKSGSAIPANIIHSLEVICPFLPGACGMIRLTVTIDSKKKNQFFVT